MYIYIPLYIIYMYANVCIYNSLNNRDIQINNICKNEITIEFKLSAENEIYIYIINLIKKTVSSDSGVNKHIISNY